MLLKKVTISGYRSITGSIELHLDSAVTVILGANDHGKTNILRAIEHLNPGTAFDEASDLSWDCNDTDNLPAVEFLFELTVDERTEIASTIKASLPDVSDEDPEALDEDNKASSVPASATEPQVVIPKFIVASRKGTKGSLKYFDAISGDQLNGVLDEFTPRVELIQPTSHVSDSVTAAEIMKDANGFTRGIFRYAGLDPDESEDLFNQNPKTQRRLEDASGVLNDTIKRSWSQGKDLEFLLTHNSAKKSIELHIKDPSVANRYVSASQRSAGFTQFFTVKTILYARQQEHPARSYIWLFDEPGIYLHPAGQQDLLQVIESLGRSNQVVYVTHSLFMINKSFPTRHRLVLKGESGTQIEGKPFVGRWGRALSALGMSLSGTILFANHVLLVEGDSDPIFLNAVLQKLIEVGRLDADLNSFAAISTGQSADADALIRILLESQPSPKIAVLVDGDDGGKKRLERLKSLLTARAIPSRMLTEGTSIEDHLPNLPDLFVKAVALYCGKLKADATGNSLNQEDLLPAVRESFDARFNSNASIKGIAGWLTQDVPGALGLNGSPSKVGVAREYAILLNDVPKDEFKSGARVSPLVKWITENLSIPPLGIDEPKILEPLPAETS